MKSKKTLKNNKHDKIVNDYKNSKKNHLERLATKMLKKDKDFNKLKEKNINSNFLDLF
jgi:hypothetical protein